MSKEDKIHWKQLLIGGVITFIVTMASAILFFNYQNREPLLYYSAPDTIPFHGEDQIIGIYHISISNDGKKASKNVICVFQIPGATIQAWNISTELLLALEFSHSITNDTLKLEFPLINPNEIIRILILATAETTLPVRPIVAIRAEDIIGIDKAQKEEPNIILSFMSVLASGMSISAASLMIYRLLRQKFIERIITKRS